MSLSLDATVIPCHGHSMPLSFGVTVTQCHGSLNATVTQCHGHSMPLSSHAHHSYRSAFKGSTFVARRAGINEAINATATNTSATPTNVITSIGFTPNNNDVR